MSGMRRLLVQRFVLIALAGAALGAAVWFAFLRPSREATSAASGPGATLIAPATRRLLPDLSGAVLTPPPPRVSLRSGDGRPSFVDVWASWCIPCKEEAPMLARLHRRFGRQIRFLGIDVEDQRGPARAFERRYQIGYPSIFDPGASMAGKLGFYGLPTAYLLDRRNRIAAILVGKQSRATIQAKLAKLMAESG